jgi:D-alanine-D-alanine ligase-like ATP-grasp enzyme
MTVGVIEMNGQYHSFNPSITVAENKILTLEEKFQGGTGVNLTPPPFEIISNIQIDLIKDRMKDLSKALKIGNYARIDIFFNTKSNELILIEVNTLPALTPSTVIFHQALAENRPVYPLEFIESLCSKKFDFMV